jgi:O-antigen/teichoic acid export membrane protein
MFPGQKKLFGRLISKLGAGGRGVLAIGIGTAVGQFVAFACGPLIARLYSPREVGLFSVLTSLVLIGSVLVTLRFEGAIPLPGDELESYALAVLATISAGLMCALIELSLLAWKVSSTGEAFGALRSWILVVPLLTLIVGMFNVLNQVALRQGRFWTVGRRNAVNGIATTTMQLGAGVGGAGFVGLVAGFGLGQTLGVLQLASPMRRSTISGRNGSRIPLASTLRRYWRFPAFFCPSGLINMLGLQVPVLIIAWCYGDTVAGWFGMTQRMLLLPMGLVGLAISQVFTSRLSALVRSGSSQARQLFLATSGRLVCVGAIPAVVLFFWAPEIFSFVFGSEWAASGVYARVMAVSVFAQMVASPLSQTLLVFERYKTQLSWDIARLVLVAGALLVSKTAGLSVQSGMWTLSIAITLAYGLSWLISYHAVTVGVRPADAAVTRHRKIAVAADT